MRECLKIRTFKIDSKFDFQNFLLEMILKKSMFTLNSQYTPSGDQPQAIKKLVGGFERGKNFQTLLGVTGSGKGFTIANVIEKMQLPTLVIAPNKTLAAQLAQEFRTFFPEAAVEYFVSYYDYYQPEAYIRATDTYIEKETQINEEIDRLRHSATASLMTRSDVIVVASVSCIYGLGSPELYREQTILLSVGGEMKREALLQKLTELHYLRGEGLERGRFRVRGETFEIMPIGGNTVIRVELLNGHVRDILEYDAVTGEHLASPAATFVLPAKHFLVSEEIMHRAVAEIGEEMRAQVKKFTLEKKLLEAQRIEQRTKQDMEMIREIGYCSGIENYSRILSGRKPGESPETLLDYFPKEFLLVMDESHVTIPQIGSMYNGDRARKTALVENGFRLPSALDNRPLRFSEFEARMKRVVCMSATPGAYEKEHSTQIVEQLIRPTGLVDPEILVRSAKSQVKDLLKEIEATVARGDRVLVTTLTKKMAEDLAQYCKEIEIRAEYVHSDVDTLDRIKILENLRRGHFDVLVGVNLLREGLDLPEVALVAILDADKEGFLRSETSLIQTIGRAARNVRGRVILYADTMTGSMERAIGETDRRRKKQVAYNKKHHITPKTIEKNIASIVDHELRGEVPKIEALILSSPKELARHIKERETEMKETARALDFERAAMLRDEIRELRKLREE